MQSSPELTTTNDVFENDIWVNNEYSAIVDEHKLNFVKPYVTRTQHGGGGGNEMMSKHKTGPSTGDNKRLRRRCTIYRPNT